ncbi:MAG: pyrroline-5-carboxylate reductase [Candidatus Micrarchaeia archaeon]|jgi:pyrroline-5-carboxylate reductase
MRLSIIGTGKMGSALATGLSKGTALRPKDILLYDHSSSKARALACSIGARAAGSAKDAAKQSDIIILAVKPDAVADALAQMHSQLAGKLVVSIAAAVPLKFLESHTPSSCRIAAAMPNIPMQVRKGMCYYCLGKRATRRDAALLHSIFSSVGHAVEVKNEKLLDAAIITGSGNAFIYLIIGAMAKAGESAGLSKRAALQLAASAAEGAGAMAQESGLEPEALISLVATKKGITEKGLKLLKASGVHHSFTRAMSACIKHAAKKRRHFR